MKKLILFLFFIFSFNQSFSTRNLNNELIEAVSLMEFDKIDDLLEKGADINARDEHGRSLLFFAIKNESIELMEYLIKKKININLLDNSQNSALQYAVLKKFEKGIKLLLKHKININHQNEYGKTAVFDAIKNQDTQTLELLIKHGADIHITDYQGNSALRYATHKNFQKEVEILIGYGLDINTQNTLGETPVFEAARNHNLEMMIFLYENGADIHHIDKQANPFFHYTVHKSFDKGVMFLTKKLDINLRDSYGQSPVFRAIANKDLKMLNILIEAGIDLKILDYQKKSLLQYACLKNFKEAVEIFLKKDLDINNRDIYGNTALFDAIKNDNPEIIDLLIKHGADLTIIDLQGHSVMSYAVLMKSYKAIRILSQKLDINTINHHGKPIFFEAIFNHDLEMLEYLNHKKANFYLTGKEGKSAMHYTVLREFEKGIEFLAQKGLSPNFKDIYGKTPLFDAVKINNLSMVKTLIKIGADLQVTDNNGNNLLDVAAYEGLSEMVEFLIEQGLKVNHRNKFGKTALFSAIKGKSIKVMEVLIKHGAFINLKDSFNASPLHQSIYEKFPEGSFLLIENGADLNAINNKGETPLMKAIDKRSLDVTKKLIDHGADLRLPVQKGHSLASYSIAKRFSKGTKLLVEKDRSIIELADYNGQTAIFSAINHKDPYALNYLISMGANINKKDRNGNTPLFYCFYKKFKEGKDILIENNNLDLKITDLNGRNILFQAIKYNDFESFKKLVKKGASLNIKDHKNNSLLHYAAIKSFNEVVYFLIENDLASIEEPDSMGRSILYKAIDTENKELMRYLIEKKANLNTEDKYGNSPLDQIVYRSLHEFAEILIENGANVNHKNSYLRTPIFKAIQKKDIPMIILLIKQNALLDIIDKNGMSIYEFVNIKGLKKEIMPLLPEKSQNQLNNLPIKERSLNRKLRFKNKR